MGINKNILYILFLCTKKSQEVENLPTINQLVRQRRQSKTYKSDSPALSRNFNSIKKSYTEANSPQKKRRLYFSKNYDS